MKFNILLKGGTTYALKIILNTNFKKNLYYKKYSSCELLLKIFYCK